jgi:thiopeptide-type bacteriocin biosynthesis protein
MVLADGDNTLPVDLDNALSVEAFVQAVKDRDEAALEELFPAPDQLCAAGPEGRFVHELVIPFVQTGDPLRNAAEPTSDRSRPSPPSVRRIRRTLPPGSEWLFVKLYTGSATADQVLREVIGPVVRQSIAVGTADRWFFIRYRDPEPHLRVRVHGIPEVLQAVVCPALLAAGARPFDDGRVWRVVVDTYEREVERYGGPDGILLAERLFHADSEAVLEIMELLDSGDAGLDERWRLALYGMDRLLADLEFATETRIAMVTDVRNSLAQELRCNREVDHQLGRRFRKERPSLVDILAADVSGSNPLEPGLEVLRQRSLHLQPIVAELKAYEAAGRLTMSRRQIAMSYLHMHVNRLLRSVQREQEFVLYDFLLRCYESQAARNRSVAIA